MTDKVNEETGGEEQEDPQHRSSDRKSKFFDRELKSTILSAVLGAAIGYVSFILNSPPVSLLTAIVAVAVIAFAIKNTGVKEDRKWWLSNVIAVFFLVWFVVWTIFYNTGIII